MLEKVSIKNFKSFVDETTIDLNKTNYSFLSQNCSSDGILKGAMFVGANASGKSNVIESIKLLLELLFGEKHNDSSIYKCLFTKDLKYYLNYRFKIDNSSIDYGFVIDVLKGIAEEKLFLDNKVMLERIGNDAKSYINDSNEIYYSKEDIDSNTLFLRTLYFNTKFSNNHKLKKLMEFLSNSIYINAFHKGIISYNNTDLSLIKYLNKNGTDAINNFFNSYNFKQNIEYVHSISGKNFNVVVGNNEDEKNIFFKRKGIEQPIPFELESVGNQNLLYILPAFLSAINNDGMLLIDEFSSGFHNELEALMIKYFMENSNRSQMIFVSHSTNLLNNTLLRPDQEYAVEFDDSKGTILKRVSSEQPRLAQNIEKMYLSGVFGGLPEYRKELDENK